MIQNPSLFSIIKLGGTWIHILTYNNTIFFTKKRECLVLLDYTIGQTYGSITLLNPPTMEMWPVKCYCGNIKEVSTDKLLKGLPNCTCKVSTFIPKFGATLGSWEIVSNVVKVNKRYFFMCKCKCGSDPHLVEKSNLEREISLGCKKCRFKR